MGSPYIPESNDRKSGAWRAIGVKWLLGLLCSVERIQENKYLTELVDNWVRARTVVVGRTRANSIISSHSLNDWNPSFV